MIDMRALLEDERVKSANYQRELQVTQELLQGCQLDLDRSHEEINRLKERLSQGFVPSSSSSGVNSMRPSTPPASRRAANARAFANANANVNARPLRVFVDYDDNDEPTKPTKAAKAMAVASDVTASPDISLGCAADYPLPEEDEDDYNDENDDSNSLVLLELDAEPSGNLPEKHVHYAERAEVFNDSDLEDEEEVEKDPEIEEPSLSLSAHESIYVDYDKMEESTSPLASVPMVFEKPEEVEDEEEEAMDRGDEEARPEGQEDVCVLLDIDLGNGLSDKIVINTTENPMVSEPLPPTMRLWHVFIEGGWDSSWRTRLCRSTSWLIVSSSRCLSIFETHR